MAGGYRAVVHETDTIFVRGYYRKRLYVGLVNDWGGNFVAPWVEGVGNPGRLIEPILHDLSDGYEYTLVSCYVGDECVFEQGDFDAPSVSPAGVSPTLVAAPPESPVYDLTGRPVRTPRVNGIFIKDGRKWVAR